MLNNKDLAQADNSLYKIARGVLYTRRTFHFFTERQFGPTAKYALLDLRMYNLNKVANLETQFLICKQQPLLLLIQIMRSGSGIGY